MKTVAVLIPCYKRSEYTVKCLDAIGRDYFKNKAFYDTVFFYIVDDASNDGTFDIVNEREFVHDRAVIVRHKENLGLRNTVIEFLHWARKWRYDFISKVDNDCIVPEGWLRDILSVFERNPKLGIVSPNVRPSNAAYKFGTDDTEALGYRPAKFVGGVWTMRRELVDDIYFEEFETRGIRAAFNILDQIVTEKSPVVGWLENVSFEDVGHSSGAHPEHIKSIEHEIYSQEVGRSIAWNG